MPARFLHSLVPCIAALLCAAAQAQVVRCTDARTGQVTYTDGACPSSATAREVEPRKTEEEIRQERAQAAEALERKQQRLEQEAATTRLQAEREALRQREMATRPIPRPDYAHTPECQRSRRQLRELADAQAREPLVHHPALDTAQRQMDLDCLGPEGYADLERARAAQRPPIVVVPSTRPGYIPQPPRPRLTHCTDFTCFDTQDKAYPRAGPGRLPGPDGTCRSAGGRAPC
ncbi:MAG: DUF4124 domain-containing protein [Giesbergeria sp.]|nr:DUF4124 domain-containing protein [Giesbergeria sp.]